LSEAHYNSQHFLPSLVVIFGVAHIFRHSPFAIRHSPFAIRHSPFAIRHSPFAIRHHASVGATSPVTRSIPRKARDTFIVARTGPAAMPRELQRRGYTDDTDESREYLQKQIPPMQNDRYSPPPRT
jgi:hypothetical protein